MKSRKPSPEALKCRRAVVDRVIAIAGSQSALADALGVTQQAVSYWRKSGVIAVAHSSAVESVTSGAITRRDLHPDTWQTIWPELAEISKQKQPEALDGQALAAIENGVA